MATPDQAALSEDATSIRGSEALDMDARAGVAVADAVRSTLGPRGMDKMLIGDDGDFVVTNDGITVIHEMDIAHPAANLVAEAAQTQEQEVGDGTTSAVVLAGELLAEAADLIEQGLHPTTVLDGYRQAAVHAREALSDLDVAVDEATLVRSVVETALTGKGDGGGRAYLTDLLVEAVDRVREEDGTVDVDAVVVEPIVGGTVGDSEVVDGVAIGRKPVHASMPTAFDDPRIALVDDEVEIESTRSEAEITVEDPDDLDDFFDREAAATGDLVDRLLAVDPDVVFVGGALDEAVQQRLADEGILGVRQVSREDLDALARATGGRVVDLDSLEDDAVGRAGRVRQRDTGHDTHLFVEDVPVGRSVTLFVRGGTRQVVDEFERAVEDALRVVEIVQSGGPVVAGGGATEVALSRSVRAHADSVAGREQLAVEAFADALEVIPAALARNAGIARVDALVDLRAAHDRGETTTGVDAFAREVTDVVESGVVEPAAVKRQVVDSATEAAMLVLRIDEVVVAADLEGGAVEEDDPTEEVSEETVQRNEEFIDDFNS